MSKLQVLVTTMHATDFSKFHEMNLSTDTVIANQSNENFTSEKNIDGSIVRLITTSTRGLSRNRNTAIANINPGAEYIMFSDDDVRFYDDYESIVCRAFSDNPKAEAIKFNLKFVSENDNRETVNPIKSYHSAGRREVTSWGVCALAIRANVFDEHKITFNERFGTGTENYCGEDTIFLQELLKKGLKVFASPEYIADIDQSDSSWFEGFNEKHFRVCGMALDEIYPKLSYLLAVRSAYKFSKREQCQMGFRKILNCYFCGIKKNKMFHKNET